MAYPMVGIVGRPNVGKSTLFNKITGQRISIVEDKPGVTRDRIYFETEWLGRKFILVDTGGLEPDSEDEFFSKIRMQVEAALKTVDLILFVIDAKDGLSPVDEDIANMLRKSRKKVILVLNKVDNFKEMPISYYDSMRLGFGEPIAISASNGLGIGDLLDEVIKNIPEHIDDYDEETIKICFIGKPNVGKSSLVNKILGEERAIVSDIPGTTRDALDTYFEKDDKKYVIIDTAGMRKKGRIEDKIERYSVLRALSAIDRSDICILVIDATEGPTEQDTKIAGYAFEQNKAIIIAVNKWDLIEKDNNTVNEYLKAIKEKFSFMSFASTIFISAKTGQRLNKLFEEINSVWEEYNKRISTGLLNNVISEALLINPPPAEKGRLLKIYYVTQFGIKPPSFAVFVNDPEIMHFSYVRFLENTIRDNFGFQGVPLKIEVRKKSEK
ncbi:MAG: GTPase [Thermoanaerobacterium sp.]|uniref:ribosome biogenesis GTPase Der n=1 Tax=Thermoanaerobacterium sp. CMT5567-10 TaxID=3061989 RepID=UPI0024AAA416|nr:ribosome biogenesis GTPase Der [Thermoanaerobacterium sp. CMT5567-10]MDI3476586.1 GTPase [Thermoanaerobacterium sp.]MDK2805089.1 GTPase [Thermoanaerobacterium sp.]MDN5316519.1 GTPase [Thermoanaerobacterium sp.]WKV09355.1 ribosome biogenesis GTPase Der [Thermoanaerobacterium sp. CMT5567-10]